MKSLGWTLIQYVQYPYKRRLGYGNTQKEGHVKTGKTQLSVRKPRREALEETNPGNILIFNFWLLDLCKIICFCYLVCGSLFWKPQQTNANVLCKGLLLCRNTRMGEVQCINDCHLSTKYNILKVKNTPKMLYLDIK